MACTGKEKGVGKINLLTLSGSIRLNSTLSICAGNLLRVASSILSSNISSLTCTRSKMVMGQFYFADFGKTSRSNILIIIKVYNDNECKYIHDTNKSYHQIVSFMYSLAQ